jgi:hypothetical protein
VSREFVLFGLNIGNLGQPGQRHRVADLCKRWNQSLEEIEPALEVLSGFGHTGNFILTCESDVDIHFIFAQLEQYLNENFAVFAKEEYLRWVTQARAAFGEESEVIPGRRPTPGVVMDLNLQGGVPPLPSTNERRKYSSFGLSRVGGVWRFDLVTEDGKKLDSKRREGGWGALADEMRNLCGGLWNARSFRTIRGLAKNFI